VPAPVSAGRKRRERLAWFAAALAAAAAVVLGVGFLMRAPAEPRQVRFEIAAPEGLSYVDSPRISPDGHTVAFRATDPDGTTSIRLRPLDSIEVRPLAGTDNAQEGRPIWSPDSRHIAFFAGGKLKKVSVEGGPSQTICDAPTGADGTWSTSGQILYDGATGDPIRAVAAGGGTPRDVVAMSSDDSQLNVAWPEFLPDGERFLYLEANASNEAKLMLGHLDGSPPSPLVESDSRVQYVEPGYLLYVRESTLVAQPFDAGSGELAGDPRPLADQVDASNVGQADFSASTNGTLIYRTLATSERQMLWRDRAGRELDAIGEMDWFGAFAASPDGTRLAVDTYDEPSDQRDVWIYDLKRGARSRFTFDPAMDINPLWSPDGRRVVFSSNRSGTYDLYVKDASGAGEEQPLLAVGELVHACDWSRDGRHIALMRRGAGTSWDIWALPMDGSGEPFPVVQTQFIDGRPSFSPDGRWIAYESDESGRPEIYVRQFPDPGGRWQVSTSGGSDPRWSADGREIFYLDTDDRVVSVAVGTADAFTAALPEVLFEAPVYQRIQRNRYAVADSGDRFLLLSPLATQTIPPMTVVLNWGASLSQ
jgi:Tol biopolymer transport system component